MCRAKNYFVVLLLLCISASFAVQSLQAEELIIVTNPVDGAQREAFYSVIHEFEQNNRDIVVGIQTIEHERYKQTLEKRLKAKPALGDVYFWFGGRRLRYFAKEGLVANIDDLWQKNHWDQSISQAASSAVRYQGSVYAVPMYYYQWGLYYRKSLFAKYGLTPATNWSEWISLLKKLNKVGIKPIALGSKNFWTAAGWFDYLNLRLNGLSFHLALLTGKASFKDERVARVFQYWKQMLDLNAFLPKHDQMDWKEALPFLYLNRAAMLLMGNFFVVHVPENLKNDIGFFPFPKLSDHVERFEEAPVDVMFLAQNARHASAGRRFLQFIAKARVQSELATKLHMIPANNKAKVSDDPFLQAGAELLRSAKGVSQFFDRDTRVEFSSRAMPLFVKFMKKPQSYPQIQTQLQVLSEQYLR